MQFRRFITYSMCALVLCGASVAAVAETPQEYWDSLTVPQKARVLGTDADSAKEKWEKLTPEQRVKMQKKAQNMKDELPPAGKKVIRERVNKSPFSKQDEEPTLRFGRQPD